MTTLREAGELEVMVPTTIRLSAEWKRIVVAAEEQGLDVLHRSDVQAMLHEMIPTASTRLTSFTATKNGTGQVLYRMMYVTVAWDDAALAYESLRTEHRDVITNDTRTPRHKIARNKRA